MATRPIRSLLSQIFTTKKNVPISKKGVDRSLGGGRRHRPHLEVLEERIVLTNAVQFRLDYTPADSGAPDTVIPGDFSSIFSLSYWQTVLHPGGVATSPINQQSWTENQKRLMSFLNFNGDTVLDQKDYAGDSTKTSSIAKNGAEKEILRRVKQLYKGPDDAAHDANVTYKITTDGWNDLLRSSNSNGTNKSPDTYVMFVGAADPKGTTAGVDNFGIAFRPADGKNDEYYGYVYAAEAALSLVKSAGPNQATVTAAQDSLRWKPIHFVNFLGGTAAHELGHLLGLRHVLTETGIASSSVTAATSATQFAGGAGLSAVNNFYAGYRIAFTSGPLEGQTRLIQSYNATTKTFTMSSGFSAKPTVKDLFNILPASTVASAASATQFTGGSGLSSVNGAYNKWLITFTSGPLAGESQEIQSYNGATKTFVMVDGFSQTPGAGAGFKIARYKNSANGEYADAVMSYGRVRWKNDSSFRDRTYRFTGDATDPVPQNPFDEIVDSLNLDGQTTVVLARRTTPPTYSDSGEVADLGFEPPLRSDPAPSGGVGAGATAASITSTWISQFDALRSASNMAAIAGGLNLPVSLPLIQNQFADLLHLGDELAAAIPSAGFTSASTMAQLQTGLQTAGFTVDHILTDAQLAALNPAVPADFVRVSRTYVLSDLLSDTTSLTQAGLGALSDLQGVSLTGDLTVGANVALNLTFGVDTNGFYLLPGQILDAPLTVQGNVTASLGFGQIDGEASLDLRPRIDLQDGPDGRVRLANLASSVIADVAGIAALNVTPSVTLGGSRIEFEGRWLWEITSDGFTYDSEASGFNTDAMLDSLAGFIQDGVEGLFNQSAKLGSMVENIPVIGPDLADKLVDVLSNKFDFGDGELSPFANERLEELGFTISLGAGLSPRSFIDGSYQNAGDLLSIRYHPGPAAVTIAPFTATGSFDIDAAGVDIGGELTGQVDLGSPTLDLDLTFGLDASNGPYVQEGSFVKFEISPTVTLMTTGDKIHIGKLVSLDATASAVFNLSAGFTLTDFDGDASEKYYLSLADGSIIGELSSDSRTVTIDGSADLNLTLSVANPAASIPVVGAAIATVLPTFDWHASATFDWTPLGNGQGNTLTSDYHIDDTDDFLRNTFSGIGEALFKNSFLGSEGIGKYNPIPQDVRSFLTTKYFFFGNDSLAGLAGLDAVNVLIDPDSVDSSADVPEEDSGGDEIRVNFDIVENRSTGDFDVTNIVKFLSGQRADLVSLTIDKTFEIVNQSIPIGPEFPIWSFFGLVGINAQLSLNLGVDIGIKLTAGFDTEGFYVMDQPDMFIVSATGGIGIDVTSEILHVIEFARVSGDIDLILTGAIGIDNPNDDRFRRFSFPNTASISAALEFDLSGQVGFPDINLVHEFPLYNQTYQLFEKRLSDPDGSKLESISNTIKEKMKRQSEDIAICGGALAVGLMVPGVGIIVGELVCAYVYREQILQAIADAGDWVADRWHDVVESAGEAYEEAEDWAQDRRDEIFDSLADFDKTVLRPIADFLRQNPVLDDLFNRIGSPSEAANAIFNGGSRQKVSRVNVPNRTTFSHDISNGVLTVNWTTSDPAKIFVGLTDTGHIIVKSDPFETSEVIGYRQNQKWNKFKFTWEDDGDPEEIRDDHYLHSNTFVPDVPITKVIVNGTELDDRILFSDTYTLSSEINGRGGADVLSGGSGPDKIRGGSGNDKISGGGGDDDIDGQEDDDQISGGDGGDTINGGSGADLIDERSQTSGSPNTLRGGNDGDPDDGDDIIYGSDVRDIMFGGRGNDVLKGGGGNDELHGGLDADILEGEDQNDVLFGDSGEDVLRGGAGTDELHGGSHNDRLEGGSERDILYGDGGNDQLLGGGGNDDLYGGSDADYIDGEVGDDFIVGGADDDPNDGNDVLKGGKGTDVIYGGPGGPGRAEYNIGSNRAAEVGMNFIDGGDDPDFIFGGDGPDYIFGGSGNDYISGGDDNDIISGNTGRDTIYGDDGEDYLVASPDEDGVHGSYVNGGDGKDTIIGSGGMDTLVGGDDDDEIHGGYADDVIQGEGGNDLLFGNDDDDDIDGGDDDDVMTGDLGDDDFVGGEGFDRIEETGDVNFVLTDTTLTGRGSDTLDSIEKAILQGTEATNGITNFTVTGWTNIAILDGHDASDTYTVHLSGGPKGLVVIQDSGIPGKDVGTVYGTDEADAFFIDKGRVKLGGQEVRFDDNLEELTIDSKAKDDALRIDNDNGLIAATSLIVKGGAGYDFITVRGNPGIAINQASIDVFADGHGSVTYDPDGIYAFPVDPGDDAEDIHFDGIELLNDIKPATRLDVRTRSNADDVVELEDGAVVEGVQTLTVNALGLAVQFGKKSIVGVSAEGGADTFYVDSTLVAEDLTQVDFFGQLTPNADPALVSTDDGAGDRFFISGLAVRMNAFGQSGDDYFVVSSDAPQTAGNLDRILQPLNIDGGAGSANRMIVSDFSGAPNTNAIVTNNSITGLAPAVITYTAAGAFTNGATNDGILIRGSNLGGDTFQVRSSLVGSSTKLEGNIGNDVFNVGNAANTLDDIRGKLTILGDAHLAVPTTTFVCGPESNTNAVGDQVNFNDQGDTTSAMTYTLSDVNLTRTGLDNTISFASVETITVNAGVKAATVDVVDTPDDSNVFLNTQDEADIVIIRTTGAGTNIRAVTAGAADAVNLRGSGDGGITDIQTGAADDLIRISSNAGIDNDGALNGIGGAVSVDAGAGNANRLIVSDFGGDANSAVVFTNSTVTGLLGANEDQLLLYTATSGQFTNGAANDGILVRASNNGNDTINIRSTRDASSTKFEGHAGNDVFNVGNTSNSLDDIEGNLTIVGDANNSTPTTTFAWGPISNTNPVGDQINFNDQDDATAGMTYDLRDVTLTRTGLDNAITFSAVETLVVNAGIKAAAVNVYSTPVSSNVFLNTQDEADTVTILATAAQTNLRAITKGDRDVVNLRSSGAGSMTDFDTGAADDLIRISSNAGIDDEGTLDGIGGAVRVEAGAGTLNYLLISDYGGDTNPDAYVTNFTITGWLGENEDKYLEYRATGGSFNNGATDDGIFLRGSNTEHDQFTFLSTLGGSTTKVATYGATDQVNVGSKFGTDDLPLNNTDFLNNGDFDRIQGLLTIDMGDNPAGAGDSIYANDRAKPGRANYTLSPTTLVNFDLPSTFVAPIPLQGIVNPPRPLFAGVHYNGSAEFLRLDGSDDVNIFDTKPSPFTQYHIDGNLPPSGIPLFGGGDYLMLDTTPSDITNDRHLHIGSVGQGYWDFSGKRQLVTFESIERFNHVDTMAIATEKGKGPQVIRVYDAETHEFKYQVQPYDSYYINGVQFATGDLNYDGLPDLATVPGLNMASTVRIYNGSPDFNASYPAGLYNSFLAFTPQFLDGTTLAIGDVNADGANELFAGAGSGWLPQVRIFNGLTLGAAEPAMIGTPFNVFVNTLKAGVRVAAGDIDNDGKVELVAAPGPYSSQPNTNVFNGSTLAARVDGDPAPAASFLAFDPAFHGGIWPAVGDFNKDLSRDFVLTTGPDWIPTYMVYDGRSTLAGVKTKLVPDNQLLQENTYRGGNLAYTLILGGGNPGFIEGTDLLATVLTEVAQRQMRQLTLNPDGSLLLRDFVVGTTPTDSVLSPDEVTLSGYYSTILQRPASPIEISVWMGQVNSGLTAFQQILSLILQSFERLLLQIRDFYAALLGRSASPAEATAWANTAQANSMTEEQITLGILLSPEYQSRRSAAQFVDSLYEKLLGRSADEASKLAWLAILNSTGSPGLVVDGFLRSPERNRAVVGQAYEIALQRDADEAGREGWSAALGETPNLLGAAIRALVDSREFFLLANRAQKRRA